MTRKAILTLALAVLAFPAAAQDCEKACDGGPAACAEVTDLKQVRATLAQTDAKLTAARKQEAALPAEQRQQLADARKFLLTETAQGRAMAPTLAANARLLAAAAAQEEKTAGKTTDIATTLQEMSRAYASLARVIDPAAKAPEAMSVREARAEVEKAAALWQRVDQEKSKDGRCADKEACRAAAKLVADVCPVRKAMVETMKALGAGHAVLDGTRQPPSGDVTVSPRDEFAGAAGKLHAKLAGSCGTGCGDKGESATSTTTPQAPVDAPPPT